MVSLAVSLYVLRGVGLVGVGLGLVGLAIDTALPCGWVVLLALFYVGDNLNFVATISDN